ncbi:MAG: segregation ATPase FtsK/SpoIIIE, family [Actinomycetota bacterium]|nr:segregation ATPase FtsK/SpoIIIE, family [Actinomycetota bacterium]
MSNDRHEGTGHRPTVPPGWLDPDPDNRTLPFLGRNTSAEPVTAGRPDTDTSSDSPPDGRPDAPASAVVHLSGVRTRRGLPSRDSGTDRRPGGGNNGTTVPAGTGTGPDPDTGPVRTVAGNQPVSVSGTPDRPGDPDRAEGAAEGDAPTPVDPPGTDRTTALDVARRGTRRPVLPAWLLSVAEFRAALRWVAGHYAHTVAFHGVRLPVYAGRLALRSPRGAWRSAFGTVRWIWDLEGVPVRLAAIRREDADTYLKLARQRDARVRARTAVAVVTAVGSVAAFGTSLAVAPTWALWTVGALGLAVFGRIGSPADRPITGPAVVAPQVQRLTADVVVRALGALGLAEINKAVGKGQGITFPAPITRDGPGWRADVDLPFGVTVTDILDRRERLASGLRRPVGCVWPEPAPDAHAGRLVLWVGDLDMARSRPVSWPLVERGTTDLFEPVPFGTDPRGRAVNVPLMYTNVLIGAMPGAGKTFALRVLLLAAALDPTAELNTFELKGSGDLQPLERVSHTYASGPDDGAVTAVMDTLRAAVGDLETRARTLAGLPREVCPENKVTPSLARRRHLGLFPKIIAIDECQELFSHPRHGREAAELCTTIIKRGRALGVILLLATQRPDRDSLPTGVSSNVGVRFALRVMGQIENDMILGTSAYRNGLRASTFTPRDTGIGYLVGAGDDPQITRTAYVDSPTASRIVHRARAARTAAGTLTGHAIGDSPVRPGSGPSVLDDLLTVLPAHRAKEWSETLVERLAELRPDTYTGWTPETLAATLKPYGIDTVQIGRRVNGAVVNRRGIVRAHLAAVAAEHDRQRPAC